MDMNVILYSVVLLGVMGLLFGFILAIASQVFKVDSDERLEPLTEALPGGTPMLCSFGCLGMGTCVKYCQFDALSIVDGVAKVDREKCVGCGACVKACPKHVIGMVDYDSYIEIPCSSKAPGKEVTKSCTNGCIGCNLCAKNCEAGAITVTDFLATVDNAKCTGCGTCVAKCPRKLISLVNGTAAVEAPQAAGAES